MTYMPKIDRRSFIVGSSAAGAGLALGFNLPFGANNVVRAQDGSPEVDAWVVIRPDDTIVIRIARSEMGQGTMTGLAQLVAEELDADWSKVTTEFPTPGPERGAQAGVGRFLHRRQPRHPRVERIRPQGRRDGADDARSGGGQCLERPGCRVHRRQQRHYPQGVEPHGDLRQGRGSRRQTRSAQGRAAEGPERLEDRRQAAQAARHAGQDRRQDRSSASIFASRTCSTPRSAPARCSAASCKAIDEAKVTTCRASRRSCKVGDNAVAVVADSWWRAQEGARSHAHRLGRGRQRQGLQRHDRRLPQGRPLRRAGLCRQPVGRRESRAWPAPQRWSRRLIPIRTRTTRRWSR